MDKRYFTEDNCPDFTEAQRLETETYFRDLLYSHPLDDSRTFALLRDAAKCWMEDKIEAEAEAAASKE